MSKKKIKGRGLTKGSVKAECIVSKKAFGFWRSIDLENGTVIDKNSDIQGKNVKDKILVFPEGRGSTDGSIAFLEAVRKNCYPKGIINKESEPILVAGAVLAEKLYETTIPMMDRLEKDLYETIQTGDVIEIDADKEEIIIY
ncbi:hypothetical protein AKJ49_01310 [candidate division MSBL1 archaeon SCGC-AAA382A03]|uniref:phosphomevalonate dehydratase n=1 Tax=candidate division MSBL1 archaeon SCGC-AAA382A03 TaxID=1698278 RepID=A0A133VFI0_9EURY|nr:hypothetical protein AKJ49_01310 [candidate division MSBL1 archaeon SCGC-AAA382A03]